MSGPWLWSVPVGTPIGSIVESLGAPEAPVTDVSVAALSHGDPVMEFIADAFGIPEYFGRNWDAVTDCFRDRFHEGGLVVLRDLSNAGLLVIEDVGRIVACIRSASRDVRRDDVTVVLEGYRAEAIPVRFRNESLDDDLPVRPLPLSS
jgi:hypothetical protein